MTTYIMIEETVYPVDTIEQIATAAQELAEAGLDSAPVFVGDPDGESYRNGQTVFAST